MNPPKPETFKKIAELLYKSLSGIELNLEQLKLLSEKAPSFSRPKKELWDLEFRALHLAITAAAWERVCDELVIRDEKLKKLFLRGVTGKFEAKTSLPSAEAFSDYYCATAEENEEASTILMARKILKRTGVEFKSSDEQNGFLFVIAHFLEGFRMDVENRLQDYFESSGV